MTLAPLQPWPAIGDRVRIGSTLVRVSRATIEDVELEPIIVAGSRRQRVTLHMHPAALVFDRIAGEWRPVTG